MFYKHDIKFPKHDIKFLKHDIMFSSGTASDSICPKGWRLPGFIGDNSYLVLFRHYLSLDQRIEATKHVGTIAHITPLSFLNSGYYNHQSKKFDDRTNLGLYWTGSIDSNNIAWFLLFHDTYIIPRATTYRGNDYRGNGNIIRCLAR